MRSMTGLIDSPPNRRAADHRFNNSSSRPLRGLAEGGGGRPQAEAAPRIVADEFVALEAPPRDVPGVDEPTAAAPGVPDRRRIHRLRRRKLAAAAGQDLEHAALPGEAFFQHAQTVPLQQA